MHIYKCVREKERVYIYTCMHTSTHHTVTLGRKAGDPFRRTSDKLELVAALANSLMVPETRPMAAQRPPKNAHIQKIFLACRDPSS